MQRHVTERPETASPERYSADSTKTYDSTSSASYSRRYPSSETLSQRSSSEPRSDRGSGYPRSRSPGARRSLTASDSSLEDFYPDSEPTADADMGRGGCRSRTMKQKRSLPSEDREVGYQESGNRLFVGDAMSFASRNSSQTLRHISSDATLHFDFSPSPSSCRRRSDSPKSEFSEIRVSSPPAESMSPSSPDFSRSPRQSGDSDLLAVHLRKYLADWSEYS